MQALATAGPIVGTVLSASSKIGEGKSAAKEAAFEAEQYRTQAGTERALSQRQAIDEKRKADILISNAVNISAAGGGASTDKGVTDITSKIAGQGEYNKLAQLYNGEEKARGLETQANTLDWQGKQYKKAGKIAALTTLMSGASSFGGGFSSMFGGGSSMAGGSLLSQLPQRMRNSSYGSLPGMPWRA